MNRAVYLPLLCLTIALSGQSQMISWTKIDDDQGAVGLPHDPPATSMQEKTVNDSARQEIPPANFLTPETAPVVKKKKEPYYPEIALKAGIEGKVWVKLWITEQGKVQDAQIIRSDNAIFNQSALEAARQFEFEPARLKGKPVAVWVSVPFAFKLSDKEKAPAERDLYYTLIENTKDMLSGRRLDSLRQAIDPSAYLVDGARYIHLRHAIEAWGKQEGFPDERLRRVQNLSAKTDTGSDMMLILLKTELPDGTAPHFHSVTWKRSGGLWKIISWHISG